MQGGILGSLSFFAFLLSLGHTTLGVAQNSEDLRTGIPDNPTLNDGVFKFNEEDSDDRSSFSLLSGVNPNNYGVLLGSNSYNPFSAYSSGHGLVSSYGEVDGLSQAQSVVSGFGSNYGSAATDTNARALMELSYHSPPYGSEYYGTGSSLAHTQAEAQANLNAIGFGSSGPATFNQGSSSNYAQTHDETKLINSVFGSGYTSSEADALAQAIALGLGYGTYGSGYFGSGSLQAPGETQAVSTGFESSLNLAGAEAHDLALASGLGISLSSGSPASAGFFNSELSPVDADAYHTGSVFENGLTFGANSDAHLHLGGYGPISSSLGSTLTEAQYIANAQNFANGGNGINIVSANAFEGANSWLIPRDVYVIPNIIPGGETVKICSKEGEFHNVWSSGFECLICACISQLGHLTPVCVRCDLCTVPSSFPPVPIPSLPPIPEPIHEPEVSCDPLPANTPFQNPLNPCQICICQYSFGFKPDARISCEDSPSCVLPSDLTTIPPIPEPPAPVPLALCERFPPHVEFPHPFDICKNCECLVSYGSPAPQHHIVCHQTPECETISPPSPMTVPDPELLPWPPVPSGPLPGPPPGPLPGPSPHKSCAPYPPDQQFQHPWDQCQICVCNEIYSIGVVNIEVNCFTSPACCAVYPDNQPQTLHMHEPIPLPMPMELHKPLAVPEPYPSPITVIKNVGVPHAVEMTRPMTVTQGVAEPLPISLLVDRPVPVSQPVNVPRPVPAWQSISEPYPVSITNPVSVPQSMTVPIREPLSVSIPQPYVGSISHSIHMSRPDSHHLAFSEQYPSPVILYNACRGQEIGGEFLYSSCKICNCQVFGSLIVPVCKRPNRPDCDTLPAAVPIGNIVYIEPKCRTRPPLQSFTSACLTCLCQSVFSYVVATCNPIPGCDQGPSAATSVSSLTGLPAYGYPYGLRDLQSPSDTNALSNLAGHGHPLMSSASGSVFADVDAGANIQTGSSLYELSSFGNSYPYSGSQFQWNGGEAVAASNLHPTLQVRPYGQVSSSYRPGGVVTHGLNLAKATAESGSASGLGLFQGAAHFGGRPSIKAGDADHNELDE